MVTVFALALAACVRSEPAPRRETRTPTSAAPATAQDLDGPVLVLAGDAGPTKVVDGAPMGYRRDADGARSAGISFARLNEALVLMSPEHAAAAWRAMAAEASVEQLVADVAARLSTLRQRWPVGSLTYRVAPLAVRVSESEAGQMEVAVWYVGVVAAAGQPTYEEWVTDTYRLVWERGDWRVAAFFDTPGPRPDPGSQRVNSAPEIEARLARFEAVR